MKTESYKSIWRYQIANRAKNWNKEWTISLLTNLDISTAIHLIRHHSRQFLSYTCSTHPYIVHHPHITHIQKNRLFDLGLCNC